MTRNGSRPGILAVILTIALTGLLSGLACGPASPSDQLAAGSTEEDIRTAVENYAESKVFDAAVRVRVRAIAEVDVPIDEVDWSPYRKPEFTKVWRHLVEVVGVYDGSAPNSFVIITDNRLVASQLTLFGEYLFFVDKIYVSRDRLDEAFKRWYYNEDQLKAVGGEAWWYHPEQAWIVDGDHARLVPEEYIMTGSHNGKWSDSHMDAALDNGISLPAEEIKTAIETGSTRTASAPRVLRLVVKPAEPPTQTPHQPLPTRLARMQRELDAKKARSAPSERPHTVMPRSRPELEKSLWGPSSHGEVDIVVHARISAVQQVVLPKELQQPSTWNLGTKFLYQRHNLEVIDTIRGSSPSTIDVLTRLDSISGFPGGLILFPTLEVGNEYILFITKTYSHEDNPSPGRRWQTLFSDEQLEAFGGEGYSYDGERLWIVDGTDGLHLSQDLVDSQGPEGWNHLAAARGRGDRLPLSAIRAAIVNGPPSPRIPMTHRSADELTEAVQEMLDSRKYDAVAHVNVVSQTDIEVDPEGDWPSALHHRPVAKKWRRSNMEIVELFHGGLPDEFDVVNDFLHQYPNQSLDVGQEYILFVTKRWLLEGELVDSRARRHYNPEQLAALGGEAYIYKATHAWIVDGDTARLVPHPHISKLGGGGTHLEAARLGTENLPVQLLKEVIGESEVPDNSK